jgi:hypothetical protein
MLDAGLVEQAFLDQPCGDRIGLAARELQAVGERMAGSAPGPEGGLEQCELIRAQPVPGQGDRSLLSFPARPFCWPLDAGYGTASKRLKTELQPNSG